MKNKKLKMTNKEWREPPFMTLGRLKVAIEDGNNQRALNLLEKVASDMSEMDLTLAKMEGK
jgi:hypothetical protein